MPDIGTQISVKIPNMYHTFEIQILIQYISKIIVVIKKNNFQLSNQKKMESQKFGLHTEYGGFIKK